VGWLENSLLGDLRGMLRSEHVGGRDVNQPADTRGPRRLQHPLREARDVLSVAQPAPRRPALGAEHEDFDPAGCVPERLVVGVGVELDDRAVGRDCLGHMVAEELIRADYQMQNWPILGAGPA